MSTYSPSLRIELIDNGTQAGVWGTTTNQNLAYVLDTAIAGYQNVPVSTTPYVLTYLSGPTATASANQSVYAMLQFTATTSGAFTVFAPPVSKMYIIRNNSSSVSQVMTLYNSTGFGTTTPAGAFVTIAVGSKVLVWSDGTNFYEVQASNLTGTLAIANGGTGQTTANAALNALLPAQTNNRVLRSNGTDTSFAQVALTTDVTGTLAVANGGTGQASNLTQYGILYGSTTTAMATTLAGTSTQVLKGNASGAPTWGSVALGADVSGTLPVANGGTGQTTQQAALNSLAGAVTSGYYLRGNGTNVSMSVLSAGDLSGTIAVSNGGTGNTSQSQYAVLYAATTSSLTGNPSLLSFDGTNLGIGTNSPSTYGKLTVLGTGSFTNSLVSTSATAADKPTFEFRKTRNTGATETNAVGRISFYSQQGSPGTITAETAYLSVSDNRIANISYPQISLVAYAESVGTNLASLSVGQTTRLYSQLNIAYEGNQHTFTGPVTFDPFETTSMAGGISNAGIITVANLATAAKPIGASQTWQDFTIPSQRTNNAVYTNNAGRPIMVSIYAYYGANQSIELKVDGITIALAGWSSFASGYVGGTVSAIVPAGSTYECSTATGVSIIQKWLELR